MFITVISIILSCADFTFSLNVSHTETAVTTEMCKFVNPYNFKFITETTPCSTRDELLIVVHTSPKVSTFKSNIFSHCAILLVSCFFIYYSELLHFLCFFACFCLYTRDKFVLFNQLAIIVARFLQASLANLESSLNR